MSRTPFLFQEWQLIRVKVGCGRGMIPHTWEGEEGYVNERQPAKGHNWYVCQHNGRMAICIFREDELDFRFIRGKQRDKRRVQKRIKYARRKSSKRVA